MQLNPGKLLAHKRWRVRIVNPGVTPRDAAPAIPPKSPAFRARTFKLDPKPSSATLGIICKPARYQNALFSPNYNDPHEVIIKPVHTRLKASAAWLLRALGYPGRASHCSPLHSVSKIVRENGSEGAISSLF